MEKFTKRSLRILSTRFVGGDEQWEMISTRKDISIAAFIQELNQHIRRQENQMCAQMIDLKKAKTRIIELEEELKSTRNGYEEEIATLLEKNGDLTQKLGVFMGDPHQEEMMTILLARRTTSSSTTPTRTPVMMIWRMKPEQISWSRPLIKKFSRPPHY